MFPRLTRMRRTGTLARWRLIAASSALVLVALPVTSLSANASEARVVVAGLQPVATTDTVVHKSITTSFDLALTLRHSGALTQFINGLYDPGSSTYHHFLSPSEYARRYGASSATVDAVKSYLRDYGLRVGALSAGRNVLRVTGTTHEIADAFDAPVETLRLSDGALNAHFTSAASLPRALAKDVTAVAGLSSVTPLSTDIIRGHIATSPSTCAAAGSDSGTTPNNLGGYTVQQQGELYGINTAWAAGNTGVGQTIGVYELANYDPSDVATYFSCYGLSTDLTSINVDGGPTQSDNADNAPDEATLDVEETAALAPGAAVEVYAGTQAGGGPTDVYSMMASQDTASIITTSWGICEAQTDGAAQVEQPIFEEMAAQGQTIISAAGDNGSSDCEGAGGDPSEAAAVDDPASQPYVTAVGGLTVNNIDPLNQTVWNDDCTNTNCGAGGGGVSTLWSRPAWQVAPGITPSTDTMRMVPDLSAMADPETGFIQYYTGAGTGFCRHSCSGGWGSIGGTSIGAPIISALVAVAAQVCGVPRLGFINPSLYEMATTGFVSVTSGNNDLYGIGVYSAGPGYNMAAGLGSPDGTPFIAGLCPPPYSQSESAFATSSSSAPTRSSGPTISATLRNVDGNPIANATVKVSAIAASGTLAIDGVASASTPGSASSALTSDTNGVVSFTLGSSIAQVVNVTVSYQGQSIYTTSVTFLATSTTRPAPPSIVDLSPLVGGFTLRLRAPPNTGGSAITSYEYSISGGQSWITIANGAASINVTSLARGHAYRVIARALNAVGPSKPTAPKEVVTRS